MPTMWCRRRCCAPTASLAASKSAPTSAPGCIASPSTARSICSAPAAAPTSITAATPRRSSGPARSRPTRSRTACSSRPSCSSRSRRPWSGCRATSAPRSSCATSKECRSRRSAKSWAFRSMPPNPPSPARCGSYANHWSPYATPDRGTARPAPLPRRRRRRRHRAAPRLVRGVPRAVGDAAAHALARRLAPRPRARRALRRGSVDAPPLEIGQPAPPRAPLAGGIRRRGHAHHRLHERHSLASALHADHDGPADADRRTAGQTAGRTSPAQSDPPGGRQRPSRSIRTDADGGRQRRREAFARHVRVEQARGGPRRIQPHVPADRAAAGRDAYRSAAVRPRAGAARAGPRRPEPHSRRSRRAAEAHRRQEPSLQSARDERADERNQFPMNTRTSFIFAAALLASAPALRAGLPTITVWAGDEDQESKTEKEQDLYEEGTDALDDHNWSRAVKYFDEVARMKMSHAAAALYFKATAACDIFIRTEAVATPLAQQQSCPKNKWAEAAKALQLEPSQKAGEPIEPRHLEDEELKLMAINALAQSDPERAIPILEGILSGNQPMKFKEKALFVLSQSGSARAMEILARIAKGGPPELQGRAIRFLGISGGSRARDVLADVYTTSSSIDTKKEVLKAYMIAGDRAHLFS